MTDAMIIEKGADKYLANGNGDILYDVTGIPNSQVLAAVRNGTYVNWRLYNLERDAPNTRGMHPERTYNKGRWFEEGDFIFDILKKHPKRTYADCVLMAKMEGLVIGDNGILRRVV
jgi:hypothetical protein